MKSCPDCGTQYEDHVAVCLVDGADLSSVLVAVAPPTPHANAVAAVPAPVVRPPKPARPAKRGGTAMILAGIAFMVVLALLISGVAVAVIWSGKSAVPVAQPTPVPEVPAPVDVPKPIPVAVPVPIPTPAAENIDLTSDPEGAEVWEGNTLLCVTPCSTEHPASAPLPRDFVFKKSGYLNTDYAMASLEDVHSVRLRRKRTSPKPKPAPGPRLPEISFER